MLITASAFGGFAACNYTDGECWYYGEGSENAGAAVGQGGGVLVPTGPTGSYGDAPPKEPQYAKDPPPACNEEEDEATELGEVHCGTLSSVECMMLCMENGVVCPGAMKHKLRDEMGKLYKCCGCHGKQQCWFIYENGDKCVFRPGGVLVCGV